MTAPMTNITTPAKSDCQTHVQDVPAVLHWMSSQQLIVTMSVSALALVIDAFVGMLLKIKCLLLLGGVMACLKNVAIAFASCRDAMSRTKQSWNCSHQRVSWNCTWATDGAIAYW